MRYVEACKVFDLKFVTLFSNASHIALQRSAISKNCPKFRVITGKP